MTSTLDVFYFPAAVALGALHALEPGHAKALTASYLIGIKGTKRDSLVLGLSVALTHSIVVIAISAFGLYLGKEAFTGQATAWLEMGSGLVAIAIGSWMLWRRLAVGRVHAHADAHGHDDHGHHDDHEHEHEHEHEHHVHGQHHHAHLDDVAHAQAHAATLPEYAKKGEKPSLGQIIFFGAAGGMVPCPASITVMLIALSTNRAGLGIFTVLGFSLGLALSLVGIGMLIVTGLTKLSDTGRMSWLSRRAPVISASLVIVSGFFALFVAHKG